MPDTITTDALCSIQEALDNAAGAIGEAIESANQDAPRVPLTFDFSEFVVGAPEHTPPSGVVGIETSDPQLVESVVRIAALVGQSITIDYVDEYGVETEDRLITPSSVIDPSDRLRPTSVVAEDDSRDGDIRRFRLDRIQRVSC